MSPAGSRTRPRPGIPYEGNYSAYLGAKAKRMEQEGREEDTRQKAIAREREWIVLAQGAPGQIEGPHQGL
jgi:ATPase subunit of ABC transporter with duplicated ATPase domains